MLNSIATHLSVSNNHIICVRVYIFIGAPSQRRKTTTGFFNYFN